MGKKMDQQSSYQLLRGVVYAAVCSCEGDPLEPNGGIAALLVTAVDIYRAAGWPEIGLENYMHEAVKGIRRDDRA